MSDPARPCPHCREYPRAAYGCGCAGATADAVRANRAVGEAVKSAVRLLEALDYTVIPPPRVDIPA